MNKGYGEFFMKNKIYKNRQVLQGKKFLVSLNNRFYYFNIKYASNKELKIVYPMKYDEMKFANQDSIEGIVKKVILETRTDSSLSLKRTAFKFSIKLKRIPIIIDNIEFYLNNITNSSLVLEKVIDLDDLLESEENTFLGTVKMNVINNLLENPPPIKKIRCSYGDIPYIFDTGGEVMHFTTLRRQKPPGSQKKLNEEEKKKKLREKSEIYKNIKKSKESSSNQRSNTRDLARYR